MGERTVPASEYDALCDLFRALCEAQMIGESQIRRDLRVECGTAEIEWAVAILNGASSRELFETEEARDG